MATYETNCDSQYTFSSLEHEWEYVKGLVAALKGFSVAPWVTRGSSCNGTLGTAHSSTPDGVDRWANKTVTEAADSANAPIWHVLQNTVSGLQICLEYNDTSKYVVITVAKNKFEVGGAWRSGGTSELTRPADVSSSPATDREVATLSGAFTLSAGSSPHTMSVVNRTDGKGFYSWHYPVSVTTLESGNSFELLGFFEITNPVLGANPYFALHVNAAHMTYANGSAMDDTNTGNEIMGMRADGTTKKHAKINYLSGNPAALGLSTLDPYETKYPMIPMTFRSADGKYYASSMPDVYQVFNFNDVLSHEFATWNGKSQLQLGCFVFPWDGTTKGTDRAGFVLQTTGTAAAIGPPVTSSGDAKRFSRGLEVF